MADEERLTTLEVLIRELEERVGSHGRDHWPDGTDPVRVVNQVKLTSGAPSHQAPESVVCWVIPDNQAYFNNDGATGWTLIETAGAGADKAAQYLVLTLSAGLTAERRFVAGTGLTGTDGGADGDYTLDADNDHPAGTLPSYTISNDGTDRTFDANALTLHELADIVATLVADVAALHP